MTTSLLRLLMSLLLFLPICTNAFAADDNPDLALSRVVVFNAGVAFFEHAGEIEGDRELTLKFDSENINDVLKSLVLLDLDGGKTSTVTYDNRQPVARALSSLSIDLSGNTTLADLLRQLRGQPIALNADRQLEGRIVGVERRTTVVGDRGFEMDHLLLRTGDGLTTVPLAEIESLRLVDETLDGDFQKALELLASKVETHQKKVTLRFRGEGKRRVRVGYILEFPVWKTSYRLVLDDEKPPLLQGWAIVENTTTNDWQDVKLALVSGRPIAFQMDLYEPLYVERPTVVPELFSGLEPRVYQEDLGQPRGGGEFGGFGGGFGGGMGGEGGGTFGDESVLRENRRELGREMDDTQEVLAAGAEVGELFRYQIDLPVSLATEHSAMLPIVNSRVEGTKVAIYNPATHAEHPLHGLQLKNTTELHLMQGPGAVFDGGEFAGDARIGDIAPGSERLLSYALDLETEIVKREGDVVGEIVEAKLDKLALVVKRRHTQTTRYVVKNSADAARRVLIEQPIKEQWELIEPKQAEETTRSLRRFAVEVAAGETTTFEVVEQSVDEERLALASMEPRQIAAFLESPHVSAEAKNTLRDYAEKREHLRLVQQSVAGVNRDLRAITEEQDRIRKNMQGLDRTSALYERYEQKLNDQETQIEKLRERGERLRQEEQAARDALPEQHNPFGG